MLLLLLLLLASSASAALVAARCVNSNATAARVEAGCAARFG
jgi:hypothetical protein